MSNPVPQDVYDEIELQAVAEWLDKLYLKSYDDTKDIVLLDSSLTLYRLAGALQVEYEDLFRQIMESGAELLIDTSDYFGGLIDNAMDRLKDEGRP